MAKNTTIKKGMKLAYTESFKENNSHDGLDVMVLAVVGDLYALSYDDSYYKCDGLYTLEEIEARFELPKEEWKPSYGKPYYTIHNLKSLRTIWYGDRDDKKRLKYGLVFESIERCVQVLKGMKVAIENIK